MSRCAASIGDFFYSKQSNGQLRCFYFIHKTSENRTRRRPAPDVLCRTNSTAKKRVILKPRVVSSGARVECVTNALLKVERHFGRKRARRHVMRAAKRRKEVVERVLVGDVNGRQLQAYLVVISLENIVMPDGDVEKIPCRDARRILIIILGIRSRYLQQRRSELCHRARIR